MNWLLSILIGLFFGLSMQVVHDGIHCLYFDYYDLTISPNGSRLAMYNAASNVIDVFDAETFSLIETIEIPKAMVTDINFSADNQRVVWGASDLVEDCQLWNGSVYVYDLATQSLEVALASEANFVDEVALLAGSLLVFRTFDPGYEAGTMIAWDMKTQKQLSRREEWTILPVYPNTDSHVLLGVKSFLGITNEFMYKIELWDAERDAILNTIEWTPPITAVAALPDLSSIASSDSIGDITLWELTSETPLDTLQTPFHTIEFLAYPNENQLIAFGHSDTEQGFAVWNMLPQPQFAAMHTLATSNIRFAVDPVQPRILIAETNDGNPRLYFWNYQAQTVDDFVLGYAS